MIIQNFIKNDKFDKLFGKILYCLGIWSHHTILYYIIFLLLLSLF